MSFLHELDQSSSPNPQNSSNPLSVTEFVKACSDTLTYTFSNITIAGEVSSFKISQGRWVFFDLKDENSTLPCFIFINQLSIALADGMKVIISGTPKITNKGKFSFTVQKIMPLGEGSIKKAFELLKQKLTKEGLFDQDKKRPLPKNPTTIGVISSTQAAGYADFIKIVSKRWRGLKIIVAHTSVQGLSAPEQIIKALNFFNQEREVEVIAIIRGGGSADDLSAFNDENLVRAIASSRIPTITGIGHEVDLSLSDLSADSYAPTPSNVAEILTRDRNFELNRIRNDFHRAKSKLIQQINHQQDYLNLRKTELDNLVLKTITDLKNNLQQSLHSLSARLLPEINHLHANLQHKISNLQIFLDNKIILSKNRIEEIIKGLKNLNPELPLKQGYAIISGKLSPGEKIEITTHQKIINAEIKNVKDRKQ